MFPELDQYQTNGFLVTNVLRPVDVELIAAETDRLRATADDLSHSEGDFNLEAADGGFAGQDGTRAAFRGLLRKVSNVALHSSVVLEISRKPSIAGLAERLLGGARCRLAHSVLWYKPPRVGSPKPPHQDAAYLTGNLEQYVTIWTALDECTPENGCLEVVPGSHLHGPMPHFGDEARVSAVDWNLRSRTSVPLLPGAAIAFHPFLLHASGPNHSDRPRRALMLRYVTSEVSGDT